jgi:hypothetical protein
MVASLCEKIATQQQLIDSHKAVSDFYIEEIRNLTNHRTTAQITILHLQAKLYGDKGEVHTYVEARKLAAKKFEDELAALMKGLGLNPDGSDARGGLGAGGSN